MAEPQTLHLQPYPPSTFSISGQHVKRGVRLPNQERFTYDSQKTIDDFPSGCSEVRNNKGARMTRNGLLVKTLLLALPVVLLSVVSLAALKDDKVERGRYLVEEVARCGECHSPQDDQGQPDHSRWLQGAPVWFQPIRPVSNWAYSAPPLAGLPSFTRDQALTVLEKGLGPQGLPIRPPMHTYHLAPDDAEAIVAYLQSLK